MDPRSAHIFAQFLSDQGAIPLESEESLLLLCSELSDTVTPSPQPDARSSHADARSFRSIELERARYDFATGRNHHLVRPTVGESRGIYHIDYNVPEHTQCIVNVPRSKDLGRLLIAQAFQSLTIGGRMFLRIENELGAKGWATQFRRRLGEDCESVSKGHARFLVLRKKTPASLFEDWESLSVLQRVERYLGTQWYSTPGDFSYRGLDKGSRLLLETLFAQSKLSTVLRGRGLDLCSGNGLLSILLCREFSSIEGMVGVEHFLPSVLLAQLQVAGVGRPSGGVIDVQYVWDDARKLCDDEGFDFVISNPPHHLGNKTDAEFGAQILRKGIDLLKPGGRVIFVANTQLPYERLLPGKPEVLERGSTYKVLAYLKEDLELRESA